MRNDNINLLEFTIHTLDLCLFYFVCVMTYLLYKYYLVNYVCVDIYVCMYVCMHICVCFSCNRCQVFHTNKKYGEICMGYKYCVYIKTKKILNLTSINSYSLSL